MQFFSYFLTTKHRFVIWLKGKWLTAYHKLAISVRYQRTHHVQIKTFILLEIAYILLMHIVTYQREKETTNKRENEDHIWHMMTSSFILIIRYLIIYQFSLYECLINYFITLQDVIELRFGNQYLEESSSSHVMVLFW